MISHFFIDHPIFATVLSIVIVIVGGVAVIGLPVAQYPEVAPPVVQVSATYPGANAKTVADIVAIPIEQEVNGVERMLYMSSRSTNDGQMLLDVTFKVGANLDMAQVLVQNRVAIAEAKLPDEVKRLGVTTKKKSPAILMCVNIISPDQSRDQLYLSNYALREIKDELARVEGVGDVSFLGPRDYSLRIWLDPEKLASKQLTAGDVINAVREQNTQVAAGRLGQPPVPTGSKLAYQLTINTQGRLVEEADFGNIVVKSGEQGQNVFLRNLVRDTTYGKDGTELEKGIELGAKNYDVNSYLDGKPAVTMAVFQLPGSNALKTAEAIREKMHGLSQRFPAGVEYQIHYDTTVFVDESIHEVFKTLIEAFALVFIVVLVFLQDWRATIVPMIAVPVSLIGTFAVMGMLGFSLNNLSLFGLVLAIGIVVDDAIVVVENVERYLAMGVPAREAARKAMTEVAGPVIAIALVLCAVFVPTAFMAGISGQFFKQFALTIAASTIISAFNSLTLSPALCAILFKGHGAGHGESAHGHAEKQALPRLGSVAIFAILGYVFLAPLITGMIGAGTTSTAHGVEAPAGGDTGSYGVLIANALAVLAGGAVGWVAFAPLNRVLAVLFAGFNRVFDMAIAGYGWLVAAALRISFVLLIVYGGLMGLTYLGFQVVPVGFIPDQDKGYLVVNVQLPDGASLDRCDAAVQQLSKIARDASKIPGVSHTIDLAGYSILLSTNISNVGGMFVILEPFENRKGDAERSAPAVAAKLRQAFSEIRGAKVSVFGAPAIDGLGTTGGFKMQVQDLRGAGLRALQGSVQNLADRGNADPRLVGLFSSFSVDQPQLFVEIDREKLKSQQVTLDDVNLTLQAYLGSLYINDFTKFNRNWQVNVQAEPRAASAPRRHRPARSPQRHGQIGPAQYTDQDQERQRPSGRQSVQLLSIRGNQRQSGGWSQLQPSDRVDGQFGEGIASGVDGDRMDRDHLAANHCRARRADETGVSAGGRVCVPGALGSIRKLVAAAIDSLDCADVLAGLDHRHLAGGDGQQHLHADRAGRVDRPGGKERNSYRRVRQAAAKRGALAVRGDNRRLPPAASPDSHDLVRFHPRRRAARPGQGRRSGNAHGAGRRGVQRHARRDAVRPPLHAGVLLRRHEILRTQTN